MLIFLILGSAPLVLVFTLALALYLTATELRELTPGWQWWLWWLSLVALTHFIGYLILRGYAYRHRHRARS